MDPDKYPFISNIISILNSTSYLSLATIDKLNGVWINTLNFGFDKKLNLYVLSKTNSRHSKNITYDERISAAIYSSAQNPHKYVKGLQLTGNAYILNDDELDFVTSIYYGRNNIFYDPNLIMKKLTKDSIWKFYTIKISELYIYDTEFLGDVKVKVPLKCRKLP